MNPSEITTESLKEKFGHKYNEAKNTYPRIFSLNITERVKSGILAIKENETFLRNNCLDVAIWLRFSEIVNGSDSEYIFSILHNLDKKIKLLDEFNEFKFWSVEDLYNKAIEHLTTLPINTFKTDPDQKNSFKSENSKKKFIRDLGTITFRQNKHIEIEDLKNELFNRWPLDTIQTTTNPINAENILNGNSLSCVLCYEESSNFNDFIFVKTCGHCICYECMDYYVNSRLINSFKTAGSFPCPSCDNQLDLSLLVNFSNSASLLDTFLKISVERKQFAQDSLKYCQSEKCSKILKVDLTSNPFGIGSCLCGFKMCLSCDQEPHFPASCLQFELYKKQLQEKGQENVVIEETNYISKGKRCPKCQIYMEKDLGCNQMACSSCNELFCWNCLKLWEDHLKLNNGNHTCTARKHFTSEIEFEFQLAKQKKLKGENRNLYENSLGHRLMQTLQIKNEKLKSAKRLVGTINFSKIFLSSELNESIRLSLEKQCEVESFLKDLINFLIEIHFVCEYSYVALREKTITADTRSSIAHVISKLELVIFQINNELEYGIGLDSVDKLRLVYERSIDLIKSLRKFKANEEIQTSI